MPKGKQCLHSVCTWLAAHAGNCCQNFNQFKSDHSWAYFSLYSALMYIHVQRGIYHRVLFQPCWRLEGFLHVHESYVWRRIKARNDADVFDASLLQIFIFHSCVLKSVKQWESMIGICHTRGVLTSHAAMADTPHGWCIILDYFGH